MIISSSKPNLYFAAPLFNNAERDFNKRLANDLEKWFDIYLPERDGGLLTDLIAKGVNIDAAYKSIFDRDTEAIRDCDVCLIILDGRTIDEGAAFELGLAYSLGKACYGFQSDSRRLMPIGNNPMIQCALQQVFHNCSELELWAARFYEQFLSASSPQHSVRT